jgi:hypothetical protein
MLTRQKQYSDPQISEAVKTLPQKFGNVFVTVTKSEKLQKETYKHFVDNIIKPYVKKDKFMLILEYWRRQTNPALYDEKFLDENEESTRSLKGTPLSAFRCVFLKASKKTTLQNFRIARYPQQLIMSYLVGITIRMHTFIHNQL